MNDHQHSTTGSGASLGDILGAALKARDKATPRRPRKERRLYQVTFTSWVCDKYLAAMCDELLAVGGEVKIERRK